MLFPIQSARGIARSLTALAFAVSASAVSAASADFEVGEGYLSASVRNLVESHEWSLVWSANEDRMVSHPFTIENNSLQGALESLLVMYKGQFVADLYRGNRVVVVNTPPPRVDIEHPGADVPDLAQRTTAGESFPTESDVDAGSNDQATTIPLVAANEPTGSDRNDAATLLPATGSVGETVAVETP